MDIFLHTKSTKGVSGLVHYFLTNPKRNVKNLLLVSSDSSIHCRTVETRHINSKIPPQRRLAVSHVWTFTVVFVKMLKLVIALVKLERSIYRILREKQNLCQSVNQNVCERGAESVPLMTVAGAHLEAGIAVHIGILILKLKLDATL